MCKSLEIRMWSFKGEQDACVSIAEKVMWRDKVRDI